MKNLLSVSNSTTLKVAPSSDNNFFTLTQNGQYVLLLFQNPIKLIE